MITLRSILVPIDFSDSSQKAVRYGVELARDRRAKVIFLHIINQRIIDSVQELSVKGYKGDFLEALRGMVRTRDRELQEFVPPDWYQGLDVEFIIQKGKPADEIIKFASEQKIDLIVVGTNGRSALEMVFVGSVARAVVNHANCPVLVVRPVEHDFVG